MHDAHAVHDLPGIAQGLALAQPGPDRLHVQPRHAAARRRRRHGRPRRRRDRRADRGAAVHRAIPAGGHADPQESAHLPARDDGEGARRARFVLGAVLDAGDAAHDVRRLHRAGRARLLGARRRFAPLPLPARRAHRADPRPFEGAVPGRPGAHPRGRRARASGPQQGLQLPRRHGRSGHRPVEPDAASRRRRPRAVHRRPVGPDPERRDRDLAHVDAHSQGRAGDDARSRAPRGPGRRQPLGDRRALGTGVARSTSRRRRSPKRSPLGEFATQLDSTLSLPDRKGTERDLSEDEIERAIDEIQTTIRRYRR